MPVFDTEQRDIDLSNENFTFSDDNPTPMDEVLVAGRAGFFGSHLCERALADAHLPEQGITA